MKTIGILASHEGTTAQAVLDACASGQLPARVGVLISNNRDSGALRRARAAGVAAVHLSAATHPDPASLDRALAGTLEKAGVDLVLLAGYMKKLGPDVLGRFAGRIVNTHPALLPKHGGRGMYGRHVHEAVLRAGETVTGVTVHLVDAGYDSGAVIAQRSVPVEPGDTPETLAQRVQATERPFLVEVLRHLLEGRVTLEGRARLPRPPPSPG